MASYVDLKITSSYAKIIKLAKHGYRYLWLKIEMPDW